MSCEPSAGVSVLYFPFLNDRSWDLLDPFMRVVFVGDMGAFDLGMEILFGTKGWENRGWCVCINTRAWTLVFLILLACSYLLFFHFVGGYCRVRP